MNWRQRSSTTSACARRRPRTGRCATPRATRVTSLAGAPEDVTNTLTHSLPGPRGDSGGLRTSPAAPPHWAWLLDSRHWSLPHSPPWALLLVTLGFAVATLGMGRVHIDRMTGQPAWNRRARCRDGLYRVDHRTALRHDPDSRSNPTRRPASLRPVAPLARAWGRIPAWTQSQTCCHGPQFTHVVEGGIDGRGSRADRGWSAAPAEAGQGCSRHRARR